MNTKHVGDTSEALVLAALVRSGYTVATPFGDNDPYDLIVDASDGLYRLQIKTGWLEDDCIRFKTGSKTTENGETQVRDYTGDEVDAFAVRCRETDRLYWVPFDAAGDKNTYLRVEEAAIDHPSIKYAEAFTFERRLPPA